MDLFESLFQKAWKRLKPIPQMSPQGVTLTELQSPLTLLARILTGLPIVLQKADAEGGCQGLTFFLPTRWDRFETREQNILFYYFRIAALSLQKNRGFNWKDSQEHTLVESQAKALEMAPQILKELEANFPILAQQIQILSPSLRDPFFWGHWFSESLHSPTSQTAPETTDKKNPSIQSEDSEINISHESAQLVEVDQKKVEDHTLSHNFEKIETAEEFDGSWRSLDDTDDFEKEKEALKELNLKTLIRSHSPHHHVLQSDFSSHSSVSESASKNKKGFFIPYPEWDFRNKKYKKDFCKIYPHTTYESHISFVSEVLKNKRSTLRRLQALLAKARMQRDRVSQQKDGDEPDIPTLVENHALLLAGETPSERTYTRKQKRKNDCSFLILVDISLSTDAYTGGKRILDIAKESLVLFGEVLDQTGALFQMDFFSSQTRNQCDYTTLKSFHEPWNQSRHRLGALSPQGYTRMGAALRHATTILKKQKTEKKILILISDGKPGDYDYYEGHYGLQDIKQALRENKKYGVLSFALAIESVAKNYLPQMFGTGGFKVLPCPEELPWALAEFYKRFL